MMLQSGSKSSKDLPDDWLAQSEDGFDAERLIAIARRQYRIVLACLVVAAALGVGYVTTAVPVYVASADLLIDQNKSKLVQELSAVGAVVGDDASVLSQVELLKSDRIGLEVVDNLDLVANAQFNASTSSPVTSVLGGLRAALDFRRWFTDPALQSQGADEKKMASLRKLQSNLGVERIGRTYVLRISYSSPYPALAEDISMAYARAYLNDELQSKYDATRRTGEWLANRMADLREQSLKSDLAVQKFRAAHGLITTGGQLVSEQQLGEINSQLTAAEADTAQAQAKYERIQSIIDNNDIQTAVSDSLDNPVINGLREKYLSDAKLEAAISRKLGVDHPRAVALRQEMNDYQSQIFGELKRIADSDHNAYEIAKAREESIRKNLHSSLSTNADANETQVKLRELQRESDTYRNLYQTYLGRFQEAEQQQSFPITEARIISARSIPDHPAYPRKGRTVILFAFFGAAVGAGFGWYREFRDRFFRVGEQVREDLGMDCLGMLPLVKDATGDARNDGAPVAGRIAWRNALSRHVAGHPLSLFAETLRAAKVAADRALGHGGSKIIGIASVLPGEGKSTVASNLGCLLAAQGSRVLLIDGDLRNPEVTRMLGRHSGNGLLQAISQDPEQENFTDFLLKDEATGLAFLPAVIDGRLSHTAGPLTSEGMERVLAWARSEFEYVIIDLPPIAPVVDVSAFAHLVDGFLLVIEWGRTVRRAVHAALTEDPQIAEKCLGAVLNKMDADKLKLYQAYGSGEYYSGRYSAYYQDNT